MCSQDLGETLDAVFPWAMHSNCEVVKAVGTEAPILAKVVEVGDHDLRFRLESIQHWSIIRLGNIHVRVNKLTGEGCWLSAYTRLCY